MGNQEERTRMEGDRTSEDEATACVREMIQAERGSERQRRRK